MELRQLRYFAGVALEGNFTRAAAKLRVAQPALSRQIRLLEEELGVTLLERGSRGVTTTAAGTAFLEKALSLLKQSEEAVRAARHEVEPASAPLNIGYVWGLFHSTVPRWVGAFRRANPQTAVNLFDLSATAQAKALAAREIDLGFIGLAFEADAAGLGKQRVGRCEFMAALPANHPAARKTKVPLASLAQDFFIAISDLAYPGAARVVTDACREQGFKPRVLQTAERGHTILGLVAGGGGVTLLPETLRELPHDNVVFRPLEKPPTHDLHVAWRKESLTPAAKAFLQCCATTKTA